MILSIEDLSVSFKTDSSWLKVVDKVSLEIPEKKTVALVGESGCGKSVTAKSILRLMDKRNSKIEGRIEFLDENLLDRSEEELRKIRGREISMIFQEPMTSLNPALRVGYQMDEVFKTHFNMDKEEAKKKSIEMIEKVEIRNPEKVYKSYPFELSGGMRQRIMIAMALSANPKLLIADEPTTALDVTIQAEVLKLMVNLKRDYNTSILFITHDLGVVAEIADYVVVMYAGKVIESGPVEDIFKNPKHPYTIGLMKSRPVIGTDQKTLYNIPGSVPSPKDFSDNCRFHSRCPKEMDICKWQMPREVGDCHKVSCFLYGDEDE